MAGLSGGAAGTVRDAPRLRIVMPVLQEGERLREALAQLQPLRRAGVELVVVDGGSTDATWALARAGADAVRLAPRGRATQMNAGAAGCTAEALLFLHADTRLPPGSVEAVEAALRQGHAWGRFDVRIEGRSRWLPVVAALMNRRSRWSGIATGDQAIFVRRSVFEALGGFAPQPLMEDIELSVRLRRHGRPACLPGPATTSGRRWDQHGALRTIGLMWWLRAAYFFGASPGALALRYGYRPPAPHAPAAVAVLAKAPMAGLAKTRLAPLLGPRGAARAQRAFLLATWQAVRAADLGPITLWAAPDASHRLFRLLARRGAVCRTQPGGDLGARMRAIVADHFSRPAALPLLLVGTDCPALAPGHLQQAATALQSHDAVLVPAEDGGYVLLGLARPIDAAFDGIDWSTPRVAAQTRERLRGAGARWHELPALWDVDEPADWRRVVREFGPCAGLPVPEPDA